MAEFSPEQALQFAIDLVRAAVAGAVTAVSLYAFGAYSFNAFCVGMAIAFFCAINFGRRIFEKIALLSFGLVVLAWLKIPFVERVVAGANKILDGLGV